ncbi:MAG TPA: beta-ketoacyl synthase N-terminal-like domain-containing protein [Acidimicrobiales bacterium]|nr:beta-ketoacyl synthase N-terminal-like domain-containing protein [Acidimicrobiales bacterium]
MTSSGDLSGVPRRVRDVAIVGMSCVMPGAPDVETFWSNIVDGVDSVSEVPATRWNLAAHYDPGHDTTARGAGRDPMSVSKWGGFVPDVGFDALRWGIPPASLASIDPAQLMALKAAAGALDDAGYGDGGFDRERASVIYATGSGGAADLPAGFLLRLLLRTHGVPLDALPPELDDFLPELTEDGLPGVLTSVIAGRVANRLDLGGKNLTVDSACASVLVALDIACNELAARSSDLVLLGGVDLHNGAQDYVSFSAAQALSRQGRCASFDASADGMTLAEGAGCLVLKRLADARRDGDRIYAVVKGVAGSSDGRHLGLTAPNQAGQVKAVRRTYAEAGMSPTDVGLVEAHGTGTPTGDRIELGTTTEVFTEAGAAPGSVVIGSVKSNIGHIKCAAGIASLVKAARAMYHGVQPATLHVRQPNDVWDPATSPFVFLDRSRPWLDERRVAAVSGFGFGGTNFHAVLENDRPPDGDDPPVGRHHWPAELVALRAEDGPGLDGRLAALAGRVDAALDGLHQADRWRLRDLAAAESAAGDGPVRLAVVARDLPDLRDKLAATRAGAPTPGVYRAPAAVPGPRPQVAFLMPGSGAVRPGVAGDLLVAFPTLRGAARAGRRWTEAMLPPQAFGPERDRQAGRLDAAAGPAAVIAGLTCAGALGLAGVVPDRVVGGGEPWPVDADALADWLVLPGEPNPGMLVSPGRPEAANGHGDRASRLDGRLRDLHDAGVRVFVEAGPGRELTGLAGRVLAGRPHEAIAVDAPGEHGIVGWLHALGRLAVAGVAVDTAALHTGRDSDPARWEDPPRAPGWVVNGHFARTAGGDPLPKGLRPAHAAPALSLGNGHHDPTAAPQPLAGGQAAALSDGELAVVTEYLRILQGMVAAGSEIVRHAAAAEGRA